tara:strand:+ start:524 stop:733 length:210 start_codon:yes stop_codon:yes gene_type:complete
MTEEGYLMTDETSHDLQNRIDGVLDLIDNVTLRSDGNLYQSQRQALKEITQKLRGIRDDIPCTCGEEVE